MNLSGTMRAVVLKSYSGVDGVEVEERPIPKPGHNEVLVKVEASPINPSDLLFITDKYGFRKPLPVVPGFEGSGTVVAAGSGLMPRFMMGRRVACAVQEKGDGLWAEYVVAPSQYVIPLANHVSFEQGAMTLVNPLSAWAILEIARNGGHRFIVHTAAASALGKMLIRLSSRFNVQVVNVVRRKEQETVLRELGANHILNSSDGDFEQKLHDLCHRHNIRLAFDAIAGTMTRQLVHAMPDGANVRVYGGLSEQPSQVDYVDLLFHRKSVSGFWLTDWLGTKNMLQLFRLSQQVQKLLASDLKSEVAARYPLSDIKTALQYYMENMSGGKVLLVPPLATSK